MNIATFNKLVIDDMIFQLTECCHCHTWARRVANAQPFLSVDNLLECASRLWRVATEQEILEAFSHHPKIGDMTALRNKYASTAEAEQGQVTLADERVLLALHDQNEAYYKKFGFIFIVCATGKSASEMLGLLNERVNNSRNEELVNGAREQGAIMNLRLKKLLKDD